LSDINSVNSDDILHIPTNFRVLDNCLNGGLAAGGLSILTGSNGCGKTVWLNNMILNACDKGYKIGLWSGEMQNWRIKNWFHIIARGAQADTEEINDLIDKSLEDKLFVYNNNYGNNWQELFSHIRLLVEKEKTHLIVLDNLACMNINQNNVDKYEQQSLFVKDLAEYAKQSAIHIVLVAHPRKSYGIVRKEDISGSYDLSNMADNVFILHKVNEDFKKNANDFWKKSDVEFYSSFNSLIEIAKNRDKGEERLIGLFYESYSKRLKCDYAEIIHYSWELKNGLKIL
jgi:predicted ATP-dependent serine protease